MVCYEGARKDIYNNEKQLPYDLSAKNPEVGRLLMHHSGRLTSPSQGGCPYKLSHLQKSVVRSTEKRETQTDIYDIIALHVTVT